MPPEGGISSVGATPERVADNQGTDALFEKSESVAPQTRACYWHTLSRLALGIAAVGAVSLACLWVVPRAIFGISGIGLLKAFGIYCGFFGLVVAFLFAGIGYLLDAGNKRVQKHRDVGR